MEVLLERCAGLDVHKETVVACARLMVGRRVEHVIEQFGTTTSELLRPLDWLLAQGCGHAAMEATGVYWKPVWHILEGQIELTLANAMEVRNVPGRKSDVSDAAWLADLLAHGLIRGSFVPPSPIQQLRDLTRTRKQLSRQMTQATQRIEKVLEDANIKVTSVITRLLGRSGRAVLRALIEGETDPERLLARTTGRLKAPRARLIEGLRGAVTDHHRFLLRLHLSQIESVERLLADLDEEITRHLEPFQSQLERLTTIPGVSGFVASVLIAEIGTDMTRFPSAGHLISWAGLCPRMDESAGKRRNTRTRKGARWLRSTLVHAAWPAARSKGTYLQAQFLRLKSRRGPKKAAVAVAASILTAAYHILKDDGVVYQDLGGDYFDRRDKRRAAQRLVKRLHDLGYTVALQEAA
jgi:transposase